MFIQLKSGTRFSSHIEMCEFIESMEDSVVDHSFRGRDNYFLMESSNGIRYINYVFLICPSDKGWAMQIVTESEHIPNVDCPLRILRQSNCDELSAREWRKMCKNVHEQYALEKLSISNEAIPTCTCRSKVKIDEAKGNEYDAVQKLIVSAVQDIKEPLPF
jgi:hypothetical protein